MYNNEYRNIVRERDPHMLGKPIKAHWPEFWDCLKPHLDAAYYYSKSTRRETELVTVPRRDRALWSLFGGR